MNILFLTIGRFESIEEHAIYPDLLRQFMRNGHKVFSVSTNERKLGIPTSFHDDGSYASLHVKTGNLTGCGLIEKGISTLMIGGQYRRAVKKYLSGVHFDLILYSTPPITLAGVVRRIKKKTNAMTYLLLKDIFPQNAVDISLMRKSGLRGVLYRYFRRMEKKLYQVSDRIGCMSQANADYLIAHNPEIAPDKVEISPNSIEPQVFSFLQENIDDIKKKYEIPRDKTIFVYGGNLGKPQDVPFIIECIRAASAIQEAFFLIVGSGADYSKLTDFVNTEHPKNMLLLSELPKNDYDRMLVACDVGLIFLDHRFTIPNFPSRLLTYMQARLPVIACTDPNTDVGKVITTGGFGWHCESDSPEVFASVLRETLGSDLPAMGEKAYRYLEEHFSAEQQYTNIMRSIGRL